MKNTVKLFGIIAIVAVIGLLLSACGETSLDGTWVNATGTEKLVLNDGEMTLIMNDVELMKGTYAADGSDQTVTITQVSGAVFGDGASSMGLLPGQWYTQAQLKTTIIQAMVSSSMDEAPESDVEDIQSYAEEVYDEDVEDSINELFGMPGALVLKGKTLSYTLEGETSTYTKQK